MTSSAEDNAGDTVSPGQVLKAAREQAGLSQREVADSLRMMLHQIEHLEQDAFQQFNGDVFCRGYLKAYAKLLDLDSAPLLAAYRQLCPPAPKNDLLTARTLPIQQPKKGRSIHLWSIAATVLVAVMLWQYGHNQNLLISTELIDTPAVVVDKNQHLSTEVLFSDAQLMASMGDDAGLPDGDELLLEADDFETGSELALDYDESVAGSQRYTISSPDNLGSDQPDREDRLSFIFAEDCWVEVKDRDDQVIYAALKRANDKLILKGRPPFNVLLGYAPGVTLNYNGQPVDISVNPKNNAARMVVGQL